MIVDYFCGCLLGGGFVLAATAAIVHLPVAATGLAVAMMCGSVLVAYLWRED